MRSKKKPDDRLDQTGEMQDGYQDACDAAAEQEIDERELGGEG